ncbi:hypothetical protein [Candidatus Palauibacter sp.]|uniref:hypothetical protein n=1 Tax=Candidatus Palauibacter sp. TaxID=3101350 RepID=UPI003AF1F665
MSRASQYLVAAILSITGFGCGEDSQRTASSDAAVDSAGVDILRISDVHTLDLPRFETTLVYSTAADLELATVAGAVFLQDSSLVVADRQAHEISYIDRDGRVRARAGQEGEGPGEYDFIERIGVGADGTVFVYDRSLRRFTFLDSRGEVTGVQRLERGSGSGAAVPLIRMESGEILAALETRPILPPGLQRGPVFLVHGDASGEIVDTLAEWAGKERQVSRDGTVWNPVAFGATAVFAGRGLYLLLGTTDSLDLTLYRGLDPVTRIRGGYTARTVTAEEKEEWTRRYLGMFPEEVQPNWRQRLSQSTVREAYPAYGAISVDADGRIWIGDYPGIADQQRRWTVLEPDGSPVGFLSLPVLRPSWMEETVAVTSAPHELLDVAHGRIAVLRRGEFDEEFIEVYEVELGR